MSRSSGVDEGKCRRYWILDVRGKEKLYIVYGRMLYILIIYDSYENFGLIRSKFPAHSEIFSLFVNGTIF